MKNNIDAVKDTLLDELQDCFKKLDCNRQEKIVLLAKLKTTYKQYKCDHTMLKINRHPLVQAEFGNIGVCTKCGFELKEKY